MFGYSDESTEYKYPIFYCVAIAAPFARHPLGSRRPHEAARGRPLLAKVQAQARAGAVRPMDMA